MTTDRRTQCILLRRLLAAGPGPYTRHHAAATRECMADMANSGYIRPINHRTANGDELYEINTSNDYAAKSLRDTRADRDRYQSKLCEAVS